MTNTYSNRQRVALALQQLSGSWTNGFIYDSARRLTNVTSEAGSFGYSYLAPINNQPSAINVPNTSYITNRYDPVARILETDLRKAIPPFSIRTLTSTIWLGVLTKPETTLLHMKNSPLIYSHLQDLEKNFCYEFFSQPPKSAQEPTQATQAQPLSAKPNFAARLAYIWKGRDLLFIASPVEKLLLPTIEGRSKSQTHERTFNFQPSTFNRASREPPDLPHGLDARNRS